MSYHQRLTYFDVVFELCGDGDNWGPLRHGALDKPHYLCHKQELLRRRKNNLGLSPYPSPHLFVLFLGLLLSDEVDLVLQDKDVFQLHDFDSGEMLRCLGLRTRLIAG